MGHQSFRCLKWIDLDKGKERRVNLTKEEEENEPTIILPKEGESLLMRNGGSTLPPAQEGIFRSRCLVKDKVCTFIVDSGAHSNLVHLILFLSWGWH